MPDSMTRVPLVSGLHFDVPMGYYHGDCCPGPSVSGSVLYTLHESCPMKALASHYLSPWLREDGGTPATEFGEAVHTLILEGPAVFAERYTIRPEGMNFATREGKEWKAENAGREIIKAEDFAIASAMRRAIKDHPAACNAFAEGAPEVTGIWQDKETSIWLKIRPDWLRKGLAINYKTAADASPDRWMRQAWNLGYHVSAALSVDVLKALGEPVSYAFLTQEKTAPYLCAVRVLSDEFLAGGRMIYRRSLRKFADCINSKKWPGYGDGVETVPLPRWADQTLANLEGPV